MRKLEIVYRKISDLQPRPGNPRTHSTKQIEQIAKSIERFGFNNPVLVDDDGGVVAGHGRLEAAKLLGMTEVPTVLLSDMSDADIRAYVIADNRLAEQSGWDKDLLAVEFKILSDLDYDFDMTLTGFELAEIDGLLGESSAGAGKDDPDDSIPDVAETAVTRLGDIWLIGDHRLICGDATATATYSALLGDEEAAMVFSDPPYNVPIKGHVSGLGKVQHREFAMASGEMTKSEFTSFLANVFCSLAKVSTNGSIHFHCIDWRHISEMLTAGGVGYHELKNLCVWAKSNGGMGSLYRSAHELVLVFKSGTAPHINNVKLGKNGRYRTNVWNYAGVNGFGANRDAELAMHPTVKPVAMVIDAILDCSNRKDIVLDPFAGSGTTLVAAQRTKRRGYGVELDPLYCDVIIRRLQKRFELEATLLADGRTFEDVAADHTNALSQEQAA